MGSYEMRLLLWVKALQQDDMSTPDNLRDNMRKHAEFVMAKRWGPAWLKALWLRFSQRKVRFTAAMENLKDWEMIAAKPGAANVYQLTAFGFAALRR